jgi:hypothetical protein
MMIKKQIIYQKLWLHYDSTHNMHTTFIKLMWSPPYPIPSRWREMSDIQQSQSERGAMMWSVGVCHQQFNPFLRHSQILSPHHQEILQTHPQELGRTDLNMDRMENVLEENEEGEILYTLELNDAWANRLTQTMKRMKKKKHAKRSS